MTMSIDVQRKPAGYAIVSLQKEPVNSMDLPFWRRLADTIQSLEQDPKMKGVIICSGLHRDVFTAGNDIGELYPPNTSLERYKTFWKTANVFLAQLLISPLVTVAAIRGECPAGGCMLSLCCDYRIMTDVGRIGLNEVALGIPVPVYWGKLFAKTMGLGKARSILLSGDMIPTPRALELNLINEKCSKSSLIPSAEAFMQRTLQLPLDGRIRTKEQMFKQFSQDWIDSLEEEAEQAFEFLSRPKNISFLKSVIQKLSKRNSRL